MKFNVVKGKAMHLSINGKQLDELKSARDLGVIVLYDTKIFEQCQQAYPKAKLVLCFLKCSIMIWAEEVMLQVYRCFPQTFQALLSHSS